MNKQKLISLLVTLLYIITSIPSVFAGDALTVASPQDGSTVSFETNVFEVTPPDGKVIAKTIFTLDGEFIGNGDEGGVLLYDKKLTLGVHCLEVVAMYDDKTAEKATSSFTAAILPESTTIDFEHITPEEYPDSPSALAAVKSLKAINGGIYNTDNKGIVAVDEEEGHGKVFKIKTTTARMLVGGAYFHAFANPTLSDDGTATNTVVKSGKVGLRYDVWLPYSSKGGEITQHTIYPYDSAGKSLKSINIAINNKILDMYRIETGWFTIDLVYDLDTLMMYGTITDVDTGDVWEVTERKFADSVTNLSDYRIGTRLEKENFYAIDNITTGMIGQFSGITDVLAKDGDAFVSSSDAAFERDVSEMKITFDKLLDSSTVTKENISVTLGGTKLGVSDVVYDEAENAAILTIDNPGITTNGKNEVCLSENVKLKGESASVGIASKRSFDVVPFGFAILGADFSNESGDVYSASQLSVGDSLTATVALSNLSDKPENITAVLAIKDGKRFLSVTPLVMEIPEGAADFTLPVTSPAIDSADSLSASVIFVNNMADSLYVDSVNLN